MTTKKKVSKKTVTKKKKPVGRPSKYKKAYCKKMIDYFSVPPFEVINKLSIARYGDSVTEAVEKANDLPFFAMFAISIDVSMDTLTEWKKQHEEFSSAYKKCKQLQENFLVTNAMKGLTNAPFSIFTAKNILGWRDKQKGEDDKKITIDDVSTKSDSDLKETLKLLIAESD